MNYKEVYEYLLNYSIDPPPYDFNGLLKLILGGVDNLRKHHLEVELLDYASSISDEQADFLQKLLDRREESLKMLDEEL